MAISKSLLAGDPAHLRAAFGDLGLKEIVGKGHHPRVVAMFAKSGNPQVVDDETAWCAASAGAWLNESGGKGTGKLNARSYLDWGTPTDAPKRGDVVVFKRGDSTWQGHVALFLGRDKGRVWVIGGNQSNAVTVASYPEASLLGYRRSPATSSQPKEAPMAAPAPVLKTGAKGAAVEILQRNLTALGFDTGGIDGEFGPKTHKAVVAFQESMGLKADGEDGPHTAAAIEEMLAKRAARPKIYTPRTATPIPVVVPDEPIPGAGGRIVVAVIVVALVLVASALAFLSTGA